MTTLSRKENTEPASPPVCMHPGPPLLTTLKYSTPYNAGCVGKQGSQELITMAVKHCSDAGAGVWHNALQKK